MKKYRKLAVDSMIFIYYLNGDKDFYWGVMREFAAAEEIILSTMGFGEILTGYERTDDKEGRLAFLSFFEHYPKISIVGFGKQEALIFARLRAEYPSLKSPDCIHLATAISAGADVFFTHDKKLKKSSPLPIITV